MSRKRGRDSFDDDCKKLLAIFNILNIDSYYGKRVRPDRDTVESLVYRIGSKVLSNFDNEIYFIGSR